MDSFTRPWTPIQVVTFAAQLSDLGGQVPGPELVRLLDPRTLRALLRGVRDMHAKIDFLSRELKTAEDKLSRRTA